MPDFQDVVRVGVRGRELPDTLESADEIISAGWHIHCTVLGYAQMDDGRPEARDGVPGYRWQGDLRQIYRSLWPANQSPIEGLEHEKARYPVMRWLSGTGNLVQLKRTQYAAMDPTNGRPIPREEAVWWVREAFTRDAPPPKAAAPGRPRTQNNTGRYACREPLCEEQFLDTQLRQLHEEKQHADSLHRKWHCALCPKGRFYGSQGLGQHLRRAHSLGSVEPEYQAVMQQAEERIAYAQAGIEIESAPVPRRLKPVPEPLFIVPENSGPEPGLPSVPVPFPAGLNGLSVRYEEAMETLKLMAEKILQLSMQPEDDTITARLRQENEELRAQVKRLERELDRERELYRQKLLKNMGIGG